MICHELNLIFIHIPKTAGQSIESQLIIMSGNKERSNYLLGANPDPKKGGPFLDHLLWNEYIDYGYISSETYDKYYKFSFVRNPWFRLVSEYRFRKRLWLNYTFRDWVVEYFPSDVDSDEWRHIIPQHKYIYDDGKLAKVNFIGKYENLNEDFALLMKEIGLPHNTSLPHVNKSLSSKSKGVIKKVLDKVKFNILKIRSKEKFHKKYLNYYNKELWDYVGKLYVDDIHLFGYTDYLSFDYATSI